MQRVKTIRSADEGIVDGFFVSVDVVKNAFEISVGDFFLVLIQLIEEEFSIPFFLVGLNFALAAAFFGAGVADDGLSGLSVVAEGGEAAREEGDGVTADVDSGGGSDGIKPGSPLLVSDSGSSESNNFDIIELSSGLDVNKAEAGEGTSETDAGDDKSSGMDMLSESRNNVVSDSGPHVVPDLLNLAALGSFLILSLENPEDILPEVLGVCGVSEGKDGVFVVD
jgi:hypothetical protein